MNINKKQIFGTSGIASAVGVVFVLVYSLFFGSGGVDFAVTVEYDGNSSALLSALSVFPDGTVVKVNFNVDGEIQNSDSLQLMGGADFTAVPGDKLYLNKTDGVWVEIGRRLVE